jgi:dipeptidyl aminopeptidase/acylaminoacyl peptidase
MALVAFACPAGAQEVPSDTLLTVNHFLNWERVSDPQIAPDGSRLVYTRSTVDRMQDRWESTLWMIDADGTKHRFLVTGWSARWSPDGTRIAYLAKDDDDRAQIFVRWMDAEGATGQITQVAAAPRNIRWAPDGQSIAFLMLEAQPDQWEISLPPEPARAEWSTPPRVIRRMHYRQDGVGFLRDGYTHLYVVPSDGGTPRALTQGEWNVGARTYGIPFAGAFDFTPDGSAIVFDGLMDEDADFKYRESHIYLLDLQSGQIRQLTQRRGPWTNPVVSPNGRRVAFTGFDWTPQTYRAQQVYVMNIDGSNMRSITGQFDRDPQNLIWAADGGGLFLHADDHGSRNVYFAGMNRRVRAVTDGVHVLSLGTASSNGVAVGVRSSFQTPADIVGFQLAVPSEDETQQIERLTEVNDDVLANKRLGGVEEVRYSSTDGTQIQGWIVKPPAFDSTARYPLILHIHGGPHAMDNVSFSYAFQNYAANGFVVLYINPRGSTGYGTAFGNAIDNGFPSVDYDDLMTGVDSLLARGYVDPNRLFITGCGAGGVLTSWAIGQTDRFAAAAVRCPVVDWISFAGTTDITMWAYHRFGGFPWDNSEKWLRHSPLMRVGKVKTPTLLMTGENDLRTPMGQTEQYYQALRVMGVPTVMLRFNDEYHGTGSRPSNFMRTQLYIMDWFKRYSAQIRSAAGGN